MKLSKNKRIVFIFLTVLITVAIVAVTHNQHTNTTFAYIDDADAGGNNDCATAGKCDNDCADPNYNNQQDTCFGASWRKYSVNGPSPVVSDYQSAVQAEADRCKAINAEYLYRLALERYSLVEYNSSHDKDKASQAAASGEKGRGQAQEFTAKNMRTFYTGGTVTFLKLNDTESWDEVKDLFSKAAPFDKDGSDKTIDGHTWEDTSWFCWSEKWGQSEEGIVTSETFLSFADGNYSSGEDSERDLGTKNVDKDSVELTFSHKLKYDFNGTTTYSTNEKAESDWHIDTEGGTFTFDSGKDKGVFSNPVNQSKAWEEVTKETITVKINAGETVGPICASIPYDPKKFSMRYEGDRYNTTGTEESLSGICITLKRGEEEEEEKENESETNSKKFYAYFNSRSSVASISNNFDIPDHPEWSAWTKVKNGETSAEKYYFFSTDKNEAKVKFSHQLKWDKAMYDIDAAISQSGIKSKEDPTVTGISRYVKIGEKEISTETKIHPDGTTEHPYAATTYTIKNKPSSIKTKTSGTSNAQGSSSSGIAKTGNTTCDAKETWCGTANGADGITVWESETYTIKVDSIDKIFDAMSQIDFDSTVQMEIKENLVSGQKWQGNYDNVSKETACQATDVESCTEEDSKTYTITYKNGSEKTGQSRTVKLYEDTSNGLVRESWELKVIKVTNSRAHSKAQAEVVRPSDPVKDPNTPGAYLAGNPTSPRKYAGESNTLYWKSLVGMWGTRQADAHSSIAFLLDVKETLAGDKTKGNIVSNSASEQERAKMHQNLLNPCDWYKSSGHFQQAIWCAEVSDYTFSLANQINSKKQWWHATPSRNVVSSKPTATDYSTTVIVPNDVGRKYCNSNGYHWQYYYGTSTNGTSYTFTSITDTPQHEYWTNYDAACETIAKKPSVAFWNGGVFTPKAISTSLSSRSTAADGQPTVTTTKGKTFKLFGSWTEYLAVIGKANDGFTSGSTLSRGGLDTKTGIYPIYTPLTIANQSGKLGNSQIPENNSLFDRLFVYLQNSRAVNIVSDIYATPANNTSMAFVGGNLNITHSIENASAKHNTIYTIPQKIILVNGDVNISGNVDQIDAWIIAKGTVNTCTSFTDKKTTTTGFHDYIDSTNTTCDKPLTINGPVISKDVTFNRTFGADPARAYQSKNPDGTNKSEMYTPSEVFNLSAETYLWGYAQAGRYDSSYTEAYSRELAPRY